jgi:hypothetical protein
MSGSTLPPDLRGPEDDLFEAVLQLRHAFLRAGLEPPTVIELASWEEGMKVLNLARTRYTDRYRRSLYRRSGTEDAINEVEISGTTLRWPARRWTRPRADFEDL